MPLLLEALQVTNVRADRYCLNVGDLTNDLKTHAWI